MKTAHTPISQIVPQSAAWMPALSALIDVKLLMKFHAELADPVEGDVDQQHGQQQDRQAQAREHRHPEGEVLRPPARRRRTDRLAVRAHS